MKSILSTFLIVVTVLTAVAQDKLDSQKHLTFKGVPIDGTLEQYVAKMKTNGFIHLGTEEGIAILNGDFAGYKDCHIGITTLKQKDLVHKIVVAFPKRETWSDLSVNYFDLKEMLTEKYGKPNKVIEKFDSHSEPSYDNAKMHKVKFDNCKYLTSYKTDLGTIELSIDHDGVLSCFVRLVYYDKINSDKIKAKAMGDL